MGISFAKQSNVKMSNPKGNESEKNAKQGQSNSSTRPLSIEGPSTSNNVSQPLPNQPRQPTNLQKLLKYAMDAAQSEDTENKSPIYPLDEEKKTFLNEALSSLTVNVIEEMQKAVQTLSNVGNLRADDDSSEYENALERMADLVDNIDIANDFYKIGGFAIFQPCLNSSHSNIRWRIADIIAELAQNNPFCQDKLLEAGVFPVLLSIIDTDPSEQARIKALYAVSCIVRGHPASLKYMDTNDGYSVLLRAMQSPVEKLQIKSAFLLSSLCSKDDSSDIKCTLVKMGFIEQAAGLLGRMNLQSTVREQLLRVLNGMVNDNFFPALKECRRPQLCLRSTLEQLLTELKHPGTMRQSNDAFHHPSPPCDLRCEPACTLPLSFVSSLHRVLRLPLAFSFSFWRASDLVEPNISRSVVGSQPTVLIGSRYVIVSLRGILQMSRKFRPLVRDLKKDSGRSCFPLERISRARPTD